MNLYTDKISKVKKTFAPFKAGVKRRAQGALAYDYVVPSGAYEEQWDWDGFFIGMALASEIPSEAIFLRNWTLNFIINSRSDGYTPGCITPKGRDERLNQMKPFVAQGAYFASRFLNDFTWLSSHLKTLRTIVLYREKNLWSKKYDLGVWYNSMESGADNNIAALEFSEKTVIGSDLNSYLYNEYRAMALIYKQFEDKKEEQYFLNRSIELKKKINELLWDNQDKAYYNLDSKTGKLIKRISFNCVHPLWVQVAAQNRGKAFIDRYLVKSNKLWSKHGIRTLSRDDPNYNNVNIIKPYSNWQGPIWPIANYVYVHALLNYGYKKEAITVSERIASICMEDIVKSGGMHENYDAETGEPLAAPNFISWNLLVPNMLQEIVENRNSFQL